MKSFIVVKNAGEISMQWLGIDYGSKLAGTTAVCWKEGSQLHLQQSSKNKDADKFILDHVSRLRPQTIYIDAPLSLPSIYSQGTGDNYFYRECDVKLKAMSPMFIGGLTARGIKLKDDLKKAGVEVNEVYPAALVRTLLLGEAYKQDLKKFMVTITDLMDAKIPSIGNWHQVDAILAWISGKRHQENRAESHGIPSEGIILV